MHHKKANLWIPAGGHVDLGEHPTQTVTREMQEELFTHAEFHLPEPLFLSVTETVNNDRYHTDVSLWYVLKGCSQTTYRFDSREFYDISWYSIKDLPSDIEPHLLRFLKKLKNVV